MEIKTLGDKAKISGMKLPPKTGTFNKAPTSTGVGQPIKPSPIHHIVAGAKVLHERFGEGKVISVEGTPDNKIASIFFGSDIGEKRIMLKFAKIQVL
jgi:DNA helicase-2/ATP-dependent DNA helicase PcrA